jgi:serine/threonine-protein kinase
VADLVGKKLKDFYVLRRLGRGAMAEVYLAQQSSLGRQVALKVLNSELAVDPNYVRRFHHEARAAAALVHGGIVQIYEVGEQDGVHYIAQEYVAGRNLGEVIRSRGALPPQLALDVMRQVAAALVKASSERIVHRDIKPENIMLARSGEVKVADFGLARVQADHPSVGARAAQLTQVGVTMGTPLYMSPEQIEGRELDSRSDIYSLGVTAYHMLSGEPPFVGDSPLAVAMQHVNQPPSPLTIRQPDVPPRLAHMVERMMAKKPADRYADPSALLNELHSLVGESIQRGWGAKPDQESLTEILQAADQRADATSRLDELMKTTAMVRLTRRPVRWLAGAMLGCVLLGAALALWMRPSPLLAGAQAGPAQRDNEWKQIYFAKMVDTPDAWRAVMENFPKASEYYHNLARQGLVYHYLTRTEDPHEALEPLERLAASSQSDFQAFGIAGLVVAYAQLGDDEQAYAFNQRLSTEMRASLEQEAPRMSQLLNEALDELMNRAL